MKLIEQCQLGFYINDAIGVLHLITHLLPCTSESQTIEYSERHSAGYHPVEKWLRFFG